MKSEGMGARIEIFLPQIIKDAFLKKVKAHGLTLSHTVRAMVLSFAKNRIILNQEDIDFTKNKWHHKNGGKRKYQKRPRQEKEEGKWQASPGLES